MNEVERWILNEVGAARSSYRHMCSVLLVWMTWSSGSERASVGAAGASLRVAKAVAKGRGGAAGGKGRGKGAGRRATAVVHRRRANVCRAAVVLVLKDRSASLKVVWVDWWACLKMRYDGAQAAVVLALKGHAAFDDNGQWTMDSGQWTVDSRQWRPAAA